ncbi:MAG TPA: tail fiber protein [Candidatus Saccharimonadales bacterium]|jgi:microcystin-dependent protein|nr:tail fiber protein [Candidatus Saccharimonadales bacterium]
MSNPFLAEVRIFTGNFAPKGWALCDGQLMPISQNTALFSLLGTTYGGDGKSNFALPNLQGCAPMQAGQGPGLSLRDLGETAGEQTVTLLQTEMPAHSHSAQASSASNQLTPVSNAWASGQKGFGNVYAASNPSTNVAMNAAGTSIAGGNQPHNNMPPFLGLTFIIALQGVFPARS